MINKYKLNFSLLLVLLFSIFIAGCGSTENLGQTPVKLEGTVWKSDPNNDGYYFRLEFRNEKDFCIAAHASSTGKAIVAEPGTYRIDGRQINVESASIKDASYSPGVINLTLKNDDKVSLFKYQDKPLSKVNYDKLMADVGGTILQHNEQGSETPGATTTAESTTPSSSDGPIKTADGYTYHIVGQDWTIPIRVEDLIDANGAISKKALNLALGYKSYGRIEDENGNDLARNFIFDKRWGYDKTPHNILMVLGNITDFSKETNYEICCRESNQSRTVDLVDDTGGESYAIRPTIDQIVIAIYGAQHYKDCLIHEDNPYEGKLDDYEVGRSSGGRYRTYIIP